MEEIERELGVCKIPSLESHPEYPESNTAVAQFSFSNVNGPNFWVSYYDDEIKPEDAEDFAKKERIRGDFQVGSISLFRSNPKAYINHGISEPDERKTSFPTPVKIWCEGEVALRHSPKFPNRNIDEIMFSSVRFSLDHLIEWMADQVLDSEGKTRKDIHGMDSFVRPVEQVIDTQLVTVTLRVSADRNLDDIFRNPITATSTILTEIILEFYQEDGISYSEATRWVCLFQSLL